MNQGEEADAVYIDLIVFDCIVCMVEAAIKM